MTHPKDRYERRQIDAKKRKPYKKSAIPTPLITEQANETSQLGTVLHCPHVEGQPVLNGTDGVILKSFADLGGLRRNL